MAFDKLGSLRALTSAPFMVLTATLPADVQSQIIINKSLHLENPVVVLCSLKRSNTAFPRNLAAARFNFKVVPCGEISRAATSPLTRLAPAHSSMCVI